MKLKDAGRHVISEVSLTLSVSAYIVLFMWMNLKKLRTFLFRNQECCFLLCEIRQVF